MNDDFTPDLKAVSAAAAGELSRPQSSGVLFTLSGLYACRAVGADLEIEFTQSQNLFRSVICLTGGHTVFLRLGAGQYSAHYRWLTPPKPGADVSLMIKTQGPQARLSLYVRKALQILGRPRSWGAALSYLFSKRSEASGLRLQAAAPLPPPFIERNIVEPLSEISDSLGVSIIIPTRDRHDLLKACVHSLDRIDGATTELIVIDNGSRVSEAQAFLAHLSHRPATQVLRHDIAFNFSRLCNLGAAAARQPYLLFLNDDIEALDSGWLKAMCAFAARDDTGVVGARLLYPSGDLQHGGIATHLVPGPGHPWRGVPESVWRSHPLLDRAGEVDAVTGACLMIRRDLFERLGGFNETDFAITLNDVDLCLRVRKTGLRVIYAPQATLLHKEGQSRRPDHAPEEQLRRQNELAAFVRRHPEAARTSVFYPPNLRRDTDTAKPI